MSINIIIPGIFCVALIVVVFLYRNSTLDKLALLPDEKILYEESRVRVEQSGSPESVIFNNCIVRVTDKRIIIGQKMLLSKRYVLRHVIYYNCAIPSTDLKISFKKGYLTFNIQKSGIHITDSAEGCRIKVLIPESALTKGQYIKYKTSYPDNYRELIKA
jgi:hypothetical protein